MECPDLNASVRFTGLQFVIRNQDPFAWTDCRFTLNDSYEYHADRFERNSEVEVGPPRFTTASALGTSAYRHDVRHFTERGQPLL